MFGLLKRMFGRWAKKALPNGQHSSTEPAASVPAGEPREGHDTRILNLALDRADEVIRKIRECEKAIEEEMAPDEEEMENPR